MITRSFELRVPWCYFCIQYDVAPGDTTITRKQLTRVARRLLDTHGFDNGTSKERKLDYHSQYFELLRAFDGWPLTEQTVQAMEAVLRMHGKAKPTRVDVTLRKNRWTPARLPVWSGVDCALPLRAEIPSPKVIYGHHRVIARQVVDLPPCHPPPSTSTTKPSRP